MTSKEKFKKVQKTQIVTRSQTKKNQSTHTQTDSDICSCPQSPPSHTLVPVMEEEQKQQLAKVATLLETLQKGMEKEYGTCREQLDSLQLSLEKKPSPHGFKLERFDGNPLTDAMTWLDTFRRLAKIKQFG